MIAHDPLRLSSARCRGAPAATRAARRLMPGASVSAAASGAAVGSARAVPGTGSALSLTVPTTACATPSRSHATSRAGAASPRRAPPRKPRGRPDEAGRNPRAGRLLLLFEVERRSYGGLPKPGKGHPGWRSRSAISSTRPCRSASPGPTAPHAQAIRRARAAPQDRNLSAIGRAVSLWLRRGRRQGRLRVQFVQAEGQHGREPGDRQERGVGTRPFSRLRTASSDTSDERAISPAESRAACLRSASILPSRSPCRRSASPTGLRDMEITIHVFYPLRRYTAGRTGRRRICWPFAGYSAGGKREGQAPVQERGEVRAGGCVVLDRESSCAERP